MVKRFSFKTEGSLTRPELRTWGMTTLWVSWIFFLSHVVMGKGKRCRDLQALQGLLHTWGTRCLRPTLHSIFKVHIGQPNYSCTTTGTLAGELIHPGNIIGAHILLPSTQWCRRCRPRIFWLSSTPRAGFHPGYSAPSGSTSRRWAGAPAALGWLNRPGLHCKGRENLTVIHPRAHRSRAETTC